MVYKIYKARKQKGTKQLLALCSSRKYPYPQGGQRKFREEGKGSKRRQFPRGGGCLERFFPGSLSKIGELLIYNSFSVEQAISFLYRYWCFKTITIVFIDHLLTTVG